MKLWLNGVLYGADTARIDPADRGLTLGDGLFETIRAANFSAVRLAAHWRRLSAGAAVLGLPPPMPAHEYAAVMEQVLRANHLPDAAVRVTYTRGPAPRGTLPPEVCRPTLLITCAPLLFLIDPVRAMPCGLTRRNEASPLARIKSLNYLDSILARREAAAAGFDDAILLNTQGRIAEASAANLFAIIDGKLVTPPVADGALPGVMRAAIIAQFGAIERSLAPSDLSGAEAACLTTALGARALSQFGDAKLNPEQALIRAVIAWASEIC